MTVGELIAKLGGCDPTMEVKVSLSVVDDEEPDGFRLTHCEINGVGVLAPMDWVILESDGWSDEGPHN